jgi:hypothetical protein
MSSLPADAETRSLALLAERLEDVDARIAAAEAALETLKGERETLAVTEIPDLMAELGVSDLRLTNGARLVLETYVSAKTTPEILAWIEEQGFGDLVKRQLALAFPRDSRATYEEVSKLLEPLGAQLAKAGVSISDEETIHSSTLKAFFRERAGSGGSLPPGVFVGSRAKIRAPKS